MRGKTPQCVLCRRKANELPPLTRACATDKWGGYAPWPNYNKVLGPNGVVIGKTPYGKACLTTRIVYTLIGYHAMY